MSGAINSVAAIDWYFLLLLTGSPPAAICIKLTSVAVCSALKSSTAS